MGYWDKRDCMDDPSILQVIETYNIKSHIQAPGTPTYLEALSGEHAYGY